MARKMMKRSLALGALMAFAITGSAMAGELTGNETSVVDAVGNYTLATNEVTIDATKGTWNKAGAWDGLVLGYASETPTDFVVVKMAENQKLKLINAGDAWWGSGVIANTKIIGGENTVVDLHHDGNPVLGYHSQDYIEADKVYLSTDFENAIYGSATFDKHTIVANYVEISSKGRAVFTQDGENNITAKELVIVSDRSAEGKPNNAITVNGEGVTNINADKLTFEGGIDLLNKEKATVNFRSQDGKSTPTTMQINGNINAQVGTLTGFNVSGAESYVNGTINTGDNDKAPITFSNGATWTNNGASNVKNLTVDGGIIDQNSGENIVIGNLSGDATVKFSANGKVLVGASDGSVTITDANKVGQFGVKDKEIDAKVVVEESAVLGEGYTDVEYEESAKDGYFMGKLGETNYKANTTNTGIADMAALGLAAWRADNGTLMKRMGELRNANGEQGTWARMTRTESEYGVANMQGNTYSVGYDQKVANDWTVGAAITYKDASASSTKGSADIEQKGIAFYGTKLNENGTYIDVVAKYTNLDNDYTVNGGIGSGDYDAGAYSLSAEYGKRFTQDNGFWVEPQAELTYGHVGSASYTTAAGKAAQDSFDSFVGRVGVLVGKDVAAGNVYAKASYLYDFDGEASMTFSDNAKNVATYNDDLGGGWFEVGVGTNINLSKATYVYADVEKTFSGDVDTKWQWNLGVRYSF